jgi:hypothetical protein
MMAFTKLELEPQNRLQDLESLKAAIKGMESLDLGKIHLNPHGIPHYPGKTAVEIIADFLKRLREHAISTIEQGQYTAGTLDTMPLDIVITVPAVSMSWIYILLTLMAPDICL